MADTMREAIEQTGSLIGEIRISRDGTRVLRVYKYQSGQNSYVALQAFQIRLDGEYLLRHVSIHENKIKELQALLDKAAESR